MCHSLPQLMWHCTVAGFGKQAIRGISLPFGSARQLGMTLTLIVPSPPPPSTAAWIRASL